MKLRNTLLTTFLFLLVIIFKAAPVSGLAYVKGGVAILGEGIVAPQCSLGTRCSISFIGVDFSWSLAAAKKKQVCMYTSPRAALLIYLTPWCTHNAYVGGGASWTYLADVKNMKGWTGLQGDVFVGCEWSIISCLRTFTEAQIAFPARRFLQRFGGIHLDPIYTFSIGIGI